MFVEGPLLATQVPRTPAPTRCRACQLQLCKSRSQPPHASLKETSRNAVNGAVVFQCEACDASLLHTMDLEKPGWSQLR